MVKSVAELGVKAQTVQVHYQGFHASELQGPYME